MPDSSLAPALRGTRSQREADEYSRPGRDRGRRIAEASPLRADRARDRIDTAARKRYEPGLVLLGRPRLTPANPPWEGEAWKTRILPEPGCRRSMRSTSGGIRAAEPPPATLREEHPGRAHPRSYMQSLQCRRGNREISV